jgi:hypothetical protein
MRSKAAVISRYQQRCQHQSAKDDARDSILCGTLDRWTSVTKEIPAMELPAPGPSSRYRGSGELRAGARLVFVVEP